MEAANWEDETGRSQVQGHPGQLCETLVITSIKTGLWIQFSDRDLFHHTCETLDLIPRTRKEKDGERGEEKRGKGWGEEREKERKASREMLGTSYPMSINDGHCTTAMSQPGC